MKIPYRWDSYSDQPYQLKDKEYKKKMRRHELLSLVKTFLTALITLPISLIMMPFIKRTTMDSKTFFSMGVDFEREPEATLALLDELESEAILLRLKLWEMEKLESLKAFMKENKNRKIILKIMQDREHVQDLELTKKDFKTIFISLDGLVDIYEIGTTINRTKWGFFGVDEYLRFYQVAYDLKQSEFPQIQLIGSGVIDFEYHFTAHTLFHFYKQKFNGVASLLYVDRRGAPENLQMGFDLADKIALLSTMVWLSPKSAHTLYITETNWPISGTAPYAPTSEHECISEELYADYMLRYHLFAFASQQVQSVSWHQLIAPGYGLIDNREGIIKRNAFETYKYMVKNLKNAQFLRLDIERGYYIFQCLVDEKLLQIHWSLKPTTLQNEEHFEAYSSSGILIEDKTLNIGSSPLYIHIKDAV
jgi:hypothetical protein